MDKQETTPIYLSCRNLILKEHNIELQRRHRHRRPWASMPDGPAAPSVFNATDRTSILFIYDRMGITGQEVRGDDRGQISRFNWLPGVSVSVYSTWCRSLLLCYSTCYLGIFGLEGAINCILAWTSHQGTTSEKRTKALLPKCPLFGGSTVKLKWKWRILPLFF